MLRKLCSTYCLDKHIPNFEKIHFHALQDCTAEWIKTSALLIQVKTPDLHTCPWVENGKKPYYYIHCHFISDLYVLLVECSGSQTCRAWTRSLHSLFWLSWAIKFCISRTVLRDSRKSAVVYCAALSARDANEIFGTVIDCSIPNWIRRSYEFELLFHKVQLTPWSISFNLQDILIIQINQN